MYYSEIQNTELHQLLVGYAFAFLFILLLVLCFVSLFFDLLLSGDHQSVNQKHYHKYYTVILGYVTLDPRGLMMPMKIALNMNCWTFLEKCSTMYSTEVECVMLLYEIWIPLMKEDRRYSFCIFSVYITVILSELCSLVHSHLPPFFSLTNLSTP